MSAFLRSRRASGDRGAVIPIIALALVTLITMTAFSVDLGRQMLRRRQAQAAADVIALDMSRLLDGRGASAIESDPTWSTTLSQAATRNSWPTNKVSAETGTFDRNTGVFTRTLGTSVPDSVRVITTETVDYFFADIIGAADGTVRRTAIAQPSAETFGGLGSVFAGFQYYKDGISASYDLQAEYRSKMLNVFFAQHFGFSSPLPETGLGLDALGYKGISNGNVRLEDMAAQAGFGSTEEMLSSSMSARDFLNAEARALQASGDSADVAAGNQIAQFASQTSSSQRVTMGEFIDVSQGNGSNVGDYTINALSLMQAAGQFMNGPSCQAPPPHPSCNFFSGTVSTSIPGVPTVPVKVAVIEGMQFRAGRQGDGPCTPPTLANYCGPQTSQVRVEVSIPITLNLTPYGVPLVQATTIPMIFESAKATSTFPRVSCGVPSSNNQVDYKVTTNGVAAHIGSVSDAVLQSSNTMTIQAQALLHGSINIGLASVDLDSATTVSESKTFKNNAIYNGGIAANAGILGGIESHTFVGNTIDNMNPASWRYNGGVGNTSISTTMFNNMGISNSVLNTALSSALNAQLNNLDNLLIDPLLSSLGVTIAGADGEIHNTFCSPALVN